MESMMLEMRVCSYMSDISLAVLEHRFSFKALVCTVFFGLLWFRAASEREPGCFFLFCLQIKSSMAVAELGPIDAVCCMEVIDSLVCVFAGVGFSALCHCLWHQQCAFSLLLQALCAWLLAALGGLCVCRRWARGHFACHTHSDHFEPALLQFLALGSKAVDWLWLGQTKTGWRIGGSRSVVYRVTQQRDGGLSLNVLGKDTRHEGHE